eukprot:TRINITY_DN1543_c0_g1_i1.p1 TRINITY_DN1543_c0_g1~~TRINITY_DN1543_c0_g1_i1.p1  ORF type:complete len:222 (-),score=45.87 TRINITY_DN1543_c0_g1_i1:402-1016(-)
MDEEGPKPARESRRRRRREDRQAREEDLGSVFDGIHTQQFEYLDHTADVQIHSWGSTFAQSLEQLGLGMLSYMTNLGNVDQETRSTIIHAEGHDAMSLVFSFLNEILYQFHGEGLVFRRLSVDNVDLGDWTVRCRCLGEPFNLLKHTQGTEVKAITYSNMQVWLRKDEKCIDDDGDGGDRVSLETQGWQQSPDDMFHIFVIVDI